LVVVSWEKSHIEKEGDRRLENIFLREEERKIPFPKLKTALLKN